MVLWAKLPWSVEKDRQTKRVAAKVVRDTTSETVQGFVRDHAQGGTMVYRDDAGAYNGLAPEFGYEAVKHSVGEYVRGMAHTIGIESFWSILKRAHKGVYHKISVKHLDRYVKEFAGRHNVRELDTIEQVGAAVGGMLGKRPVYQELIAENGLDSGARW